MKPLGRGLVATVTGEFDPEDVDDVKGQNSLNGQPSFALNVEETGTLESGDVYVAGVMVDRTESRVKVPKVDSDGEISITSEDQVVADWSKWAVVSGEFAIAWDEWAFEYLLFELPIYDYEEQLLRLNEFYEDEPLKEVTSVGFQARQDHAEKGTVHGKSVDRDEDLGEDIRDGTYLNELRYSQMWDRVAGKVKAYLAASGYVELYNPSSASTSVYLEYVQDKILPYVEADVDDEIDEGQSTLGDSADTTGNSEQRNANADACEHCGGGEMYGLRPVKGFMLCKTCAAGVRDSDAALSIEDVKRGVNGDGE